MTIIQKHPFVGLVTLCLLVVLATACSDDNTSAGSGTDTASDSSSSGPNGDGDADGDGDVDTDPGGWHSAECVVTTCEGKLYQCGDCIDNDSDGRIDSQDSNCLGPCDNNESGFNLQIPGNDNVGCMRDCYFDKDEGSGNDDCHWDHRCDSLQPVAIASCSFSQPCPACDCDGWMESQTGQCLDYCTPLVPNGCDCFGCCQFSDADDSFRFLGSPGCDVDNKEKCSPCTPVVSCFNPCGRCQLCLGKTTLPADCSTGWDTDSDTATWDTDTDRLRCAPGVQPCGMAGDEPCPAGQYCITGCCIIVMDID